MKNQIVKSTMWTILMSICFQTSSYAGSGTSTGSGSPKTRYSSNLKLAYQGVAEKETHSDQPPVTPKSAKAVTAHLLKHKLEVSMASYLPDTLVDSVNYKKITSLPAFDIKFDSRSAINTTATSIRTRLNHGPYKSYIESPLFQNKTRNLETHQTNLLTDFYYNLDDIENITSMIRLKLRIKRDHAASCSPRCKESDFVEIPSRSIQLSVRCTLEETFRASEYRAIEHPRIVLTGVDEEVNVDFPVGEYFADEIRRKSCDFSGKEPKVFKSKIYCALFPLEDMDYQLFKNTYQVTRVGRSNRDILGSWHEKEIPALILASLQVGFRNMRDGELVWFQDFHKPTIKIEEDYRYHRILGINALDYKTGRGTYTLDYGYGHPNFIVNSPSDIIVLAERLFLETIDQKKIGDVDDGRNTQEWGDSPWHQTHSGVQ